MSKIRQTTIKTASAVAAVSIGLVGCAGISDFDSWASSDVEPARHVAVFAPADSHADAKRLEDLYCREIVEANRNMNCEVLTASFPAGQSISEDALTAQLETIDATHLVTIQMLESTPRTNTHGTIIGNFVWGHSFHSERNLHQVQILNLTTDEIAYSAELRSDTAAALTRHAYLSAFTRRIVRDQQAQGVLLAP